jgi:hypothetical protein
MPWFEGAGQARLEHDQAIVSEDQPALRYTFERAGSISLVGDVTFALASGSPQRIATRIDFPADYPAHEPLAFETASRFRHDADHHFFTNDGCCLWLDVETKWRPGNPDSLRVFLDELKVFYLRQLMMEADPTLAFPGRSRGHGVTGYLEFLEERLRMPRRDMPRMLRAIVGGVSRNAPCPCGRRVRYRKCHRDPIRRFRARADPRYQRLVAEELEAIARSRSRATRRTAAKT